MRSTSSPSFLLITGSLLFTTQWACAEVFKCTTPEGKTSYSQSPCTATGAKEVLVPILTPPPGAPAQGKDWAAENAAIDARLRAAGVATGEPAAPAKKASAPSKSTQQIIAECEANRGVDCSSPEEIARREADNRILSDQEAEDLQRAAAGRREREKREAEAKEKGKGGTPPPGGTTPPKPKK